MIPSTPPRPKSSRISRKAILVQSSENSDGTENYLETIKAFLQTGHGGSWRDDELVLLKNPKYAELREELKKCRNEAYLLFCYMGDVRKTSHRKLSIKVGDKTVKISELPISAGICSMILEPDNNRSFSNSILNQIRYLGSISFSTREQFFSHLKKATIGTSVLYTLNRNGRYFGLFESIFEGLLYWQFTLDSVSVLNFEMTAKIAALYINCRRELFHETDHRKEVSAPFSIREILPAKTDTL